MEVVKHIALLVQLAQHADELGLPILVDSRYGIADYAFKNAVLKPNAVELEQALGAPDLSRGEDLRAAANLLGSKRVLKLFWPRRKRGDGLVRGPTYC